jgi:L-aspartate oxidase
MVFAARVVEAVERGADGPTHTGALRALTNTEPLSLPLRAAPVSCLDPVKARDRLQRAMTAGAGVIRSAASLRTADGAVAGLDPGDDLELGNLIDVGRVVVAAALARQESRGAHTRADFASTDAVFERRLVFA